MLFRATLFIVAALVNFSAKAQDSDSAPIPPSIGGPGDFDQGEEELIEIDDEGIRRSGDMTAPDSSNSESPGPIFRGRATDVGSYGGYSGSSGKIEFKIVADEFWEKGKKRQRAPRQSESNRHRLPSY